MWIKMRTRDMAADLGRSTVAGSNVGQQPIPKQAAIEVHSPARLHFGLFNESGLNGQVDGGAGLAVDNPGWCIRMVPSSSAEAPPLPGNVHPSIAASVNELRQRFGRPPIEIRLISTVPLHVGLGARTGLLMAVGNGLAILANTEMSHLQIATLARRGGTSGVGVHVAEYGGLVIDAGHQYPLEKATFGPSSLALAPPPPLRIAHMPPSSWKVIHLRLGDLGLYGGLEADFFQTHCPIPGKQTEAISRIVELGLIPALAANNISQLHLFLSDLQELGLKRLEWSIQSHATRALQDRWKQLRRADPRLSPICLSSMGPTVFLITEDPAREKSYLERLGILDIAIVASIAKCGTHVRSCDDDVA